MAYDKVVDSVVLDGKLKTIADAIREKTGTSDELTLDQMAEAVMGMEVGGGDDLIKRMRTVGNRAFMNDKTLTSVYFPNANDIDEYAFLNCENLVEANFPALTNSNTGCFLCCTKLEKVIAPELRSIGPMYFEGCKALTVVDFPKCEYIHHDAFKGSALIVANFPNVETLDSNAFDDCKQLREANFPKIVIVNVGTFMGCEQLSKVNIPEATSIGSKAFYNTGLTNITLPYVKQIEPYAFKDSKKLEKLDCGIAPVFGISVFEGCSSLKAVIIRDTEGIVTATPDTMVGSPLLTGGAFIYIPASMWDAYMVYYADYEMLFRKIEDYPEICNPTT